MIKSHGHKSPRILAVVPLLAAGLLLAGCGGGSSDSASGSASGSGAGSGGGSRPTGAADRGLAYAQCMRKNGAPTFPDPSQDGKIVVGPGSGVDPRSPGFQKAQEACKDLSPQGSGAAGGGSLDPAEVSAWGQCIRDHGVPKFPDPQINGNSMEVDLGASGIGPQSSQFQAATDACKSKMPKGAGLMIKGGGGQ